MSERDYAAEIDELAKRIAAIERAATCKGCGKPLLPENAWMEDGCPCNSPKGCNAPAQADVGEASAEPEWPRYVQINETRIARFDGPLTESINLDNGIDHGSRGVFWREAGHYLNDGRWTMLPRAEAEARIAAAKGEKPRLDDAFPVPATVEQGPTEGMEKAAEEIDMDYYQTFFGHEAPRPGTGYKGRVKWLADIANRHVGPELAAKDAEIVRLKADNVRLKDDCTVAGNNIGYRSHELKEARLEIERLKHAYEDAGFVVKAASERIEELKQQLATRTSELDTARNERTSLRVELGDVKTKYCEQAKQLAAATAEVARLKEEREYGEGREQQMEQRMNAAMERQQYLENVACGGQWRAIPTQQHPSGKQAVKEPSVEKLGAIITERDQLRSDLATARREIESFVNDPGHNRLRREVDLLTAKLAEAEKQRASVIDHKNELIAKLADMEKQLSAATAANVEMQRDHEAMEWIASLPTDTEVILWRGVSGQCYCCVGKAPEGVEGTGPTPADAIAAAKSAEGSG